MLLFIGGDLRLSEYSNSTIYISEFTEMELKGRFGISKEELQHLNKILEDFIILPFNNEIKEKAISIRHKNRLKTSGCINCVNSYVDRISFCYR